LRLELILSPLLNVFKPPENSIQTNKHKQKTKPTLEIQSPNTGELDPHSYRLQTPALSTSSTILSSSSNLQRVHDTEPPSTYQPRKQGNHHPPPCQRPLNPPNPPPTHLLNHHLNPRSYQQPPNHARCAAPRDTADLAMDVDGVICFLRLRNLFVFLESEYS